jgi:two-component system NtrC family sensor kinase
MLVELQPETIEPKPVVAAASCGAAVLDAITYAATRLVRATDWRPAMPELLARLGAATDVSRAFLFEIHSGPNGAGVMQSCRFMWSAPDAQPIAEEGLQNLPIPEDSDSELAKLVHRRSLGEVIHVNRSHSTGDVRRLFDEHATCSMLSVPIFVEGSCWGSLGLDDCRRERVWDETEVDLLKTATALIAGAIERIRADERLRERDNLLVGAQRIAQVGSWVLDFDTNLVSWSEESWRIFGLEPGRGSWTHEENLARIHPEDRDRVAQMDERARETGEPFEIEYRILRPDGDVRILRERAEPARDAMGRPNRLIGVVHDVTEIKRTERRLRESEERYALAARGAGVGLWDWDLKAGRTYFSPRLHELVGVADGALGTSISGLFGRLHPEDRAALDAHLQRRFSHQRRRLEFEVRANVTAGEQRWLLVRGLIVYEDGRPVRLVGSLGDITDRKRAFEEIQRQREVLHQNEKMTMLGSLLAGVAHELNNPLSVVIGQVALLERTTSDPAVLKRAERIHKATERCARIVRTFLAMARQRHREPASVNLNSIVETAVELLAFQLRSGDVQVVCDFAADLPPVLADADQLHQVITNLIVNARQALTDSSPPRTIRIATRIEAAGGRLHIVVSDNGPGVPAGIRQRIFDPFFTTKVAGEGTGIGLSLCSSIVRAHGGTISLSDTPGGGATFDIALPLQASESAPPLALGEVEAVPTGWRVLIVEDEAEIAATLSEILRSEGHEPSVAADGKEGLACALARNYDLILSDIRLPVLDGLGLYKALQRRRPGALDRFAFITGDTLSADIQSFLAETHALCLEKPFVPADVLNLMSRMIAEHTER